MSSYVYVPSFRSGAVTHGSLATDYYVSTSGSDSATGTAAAPWATIGKANTVIAASTLGYTNDVTVHVGPGTYAMTSKVSIATAGGGKNGHRVVYTPTSSPGSVVLDAGTTVTGWVNTSGNLWRAPISVSCYTVYRDGARMRPARSPKYVAEASFPMAKAPYIRTVNNGSSFTVLQYVNGDFDPAAWTLSDLQVVIWAGGSFNWLSDTHTVTARDTVAKTLTFGEQAKFYTYRGGIGSRYFVQGVLELLTEDGEFFIDRANGYLYVYSVGNPGSLHTYVVPNCTELVSIAGSSNALTVGNVTLDGFTFKNTDFLQWYRLGYPSDAAGTLFGPGGHADAFYAYWDSVPTARLGAVTIKNATGVSITRSKFTNIGTNGIYADGYGQGLTVQSCLLEHLGISGIVQEGLYSGEGDYIGRSLFDNLKVKQMGELAGSSTGIQIGNSGNNTISRSEFSDAPRHGMWLYGSFNQALASVYTKGNLVDHCKFQRLCQDSGDTAGLYMESFSSLVSGPPYNTNTFQQLIVSSIHASPGMTDSAPNGVYTDNQTAGQTFSNVQVSDVDGDLLFIQTDSGNHTATNCSFNANGTANGSFNPALMDTANIGVTAGFPY